MKLSDWFYGLSRQEHLPVEERPDWRDWSTSFLIWRSLERGDCLYCFADRDGGCWEDCCHPQFYGE